MPQKRRLILDGKEVRIFMFSRLSRVMLPGCIPVDRKERAAVLNQSDQQRFIVSAQVEAFSLDHAMERLQNELFPMVAKKDWEFICELEPEHDLGKMGSTHPLLPVVASTSRRLQ